jgi:hypothetical protein
MSLRLVAVLGAVVPLVGCGGGVPLLYPARALPAGDVRVAGGLSGNFIVGSLANNITAAQAEAATSAQGPGPAGNDPTYAKGAIVLAAVAPGLAPYASARVGIGDGFEGGIAYTGRTAHLDVRRSFDWGDTSLSLGVGIETPIYGNPDTGTLPQVDLSAVHGYGADVPLLIGWQSTAKLYMVWGGVRAGWDHTIISSMSTEPDSDTVANPMNLSADRFYGSGVVGLAAGFRHVHVALELDAAYQTMQGTFNGSSVTAQGVSLAPAAALWWTF